MTPYIDVPTWSPVLHTLAPHGEAHALILGTFGDQVRAARAGTLQVLAMLHPDLGEDAEFDDVEDALPDMSVDDLTLPADPGGETVRDAQAFLTLAQAHRWPDALLTYGTGHLPARVHIEIEMDTFTVEMPAGPVTPGEDTV